MTLTQSKCIALAQCFDVGGCNLLLAVGMLPR